jgi:LysM repeat protein
MDDWKTDSDFNELENESYSSFQSNKSGKLFDRLELPIILIGAGLLVLVILFVLFIPKKNEITIDDYKHLVSRLDQLEDKIDVLSGTEIDIEEFDPSKDPVQYQQVINWIKSNAEVISETIKKLDKIEKQIQIAPTVKPVVATVPAKIKKTPPKTKAASVSKPKATPKPAAIIKPKATPKPTAIIKPVEKPKPVTQEKPLAKSKPVGEPKPAAIIKPVEQPKPAALTKKPVEQPKPVTQEKPLEKSKPVGETKPLGKSEPVKIIPKKAAKPIIAEKSKQVTKDVVPPVSETKVLPKVISAPKSVPAKPETVKYIFHRVEKGETLYRISINYGISVEELQKLNDMKKDNLIIDIGEELIVKKVKQ